MYSSDEDYEDLDNLDTALRRYTRDEMPISDNETLEGLLKRYPLEEDTTVYRGINFNSRLSYNKFMKKFNAVGGYKAYSATGFSKEKQTAEGFANSPKSFFMDKDVMAASAKKGDERERLSGYCGVLLTYVAKAGSVIDVNASKHGVESEILTMTGELIKCDVTFIPNYKSMIKLDNIDINKYVQDSNETYDGLLNFILKNHSEKLNNISSEHLFQSCLSTEEDRKTSLKNITKSDRSELIHMGNNLTIVKRTDYKNIKDNEETDFYHVRCPLDINDYEKMGCFRPAQYEKIKEIADEMLTEFFSVHFDLGQKEELKNLEELS
jgi:hypothetical protein